MYNEDKEESFVPLNWDSLVQDPEMWSLIKEELDYGLEAECLMKIITAAKAKGFKDKDVFMPIKEEMVDVNEDSIGNSLED